MEEEAAATASHTRRRCVRAARQTDETDVDPREGVRHRPHPTARTQPGTAPAAHQPFQLPCEKTALTARLAGRPDLSRPGRHRSTRHQAPPADASAAAAAGPPPRMAGALAGTAEAFRGVTTAAVSAAPGAGPATPLPRPRPTRGVLAGSGLGRVGGGDPAAGHSRSSSRTGPGAMVVDRRADILPAQTGSPALRQQAAHLEGLEYASLGGPQPQLPPHTAPPSPSALSVAAACRVLLRAV
ncbi:hypothetical protein M2163_000076 [Streptomyces sp. SAI-135]|nr:hypothetical protein [Streptomyces sp. SAI-090]MDH6555041.1 hypothetical protein [Streptomyces sp. SAI-041]MDH6574306.1 hypothetical protein [Streptomyces sp. SAI-117]MDH6580962.1 hypothetical protein [Streptomyces sp. SAI-133]MDH6612968.1 hypothetical protein [Streptomyces sp. SAI-135]